MSYLGKALATPASILPATVSVTFRHYIFSAGSHMFFLSLLHFRSLMHSLRVEHLLSSNYPKQVNILCFELHVHTRHDTIDMHILMMTFYFCLYRFKERLHCG